MKILIVDDELVSRKKMHMILEAYGECVAVDNGRAAVEAFKNAWENWAPFDLITLDVFMPNMDGTEVLRQIKKMEEDKGIPKDKQARILMVTSSSDNETVITCIRAGCDDYVLKPFDEATIKDKIQRLESKEDATQAQMPAPLSSTQCDEREIRSLIVDDEFVSRKKLQKTMEEFGECQAVDNGQAAIAAFKNAVDSGRLFDLITLDVSMPEMDGTEVLWEIRNIEKAKEVPLENQVKILMVTSSSDKDTIITCIQAECDDYVVKPLDRKTLIDKIKKMRCGGRLSLEGIEEIQAKVAETKSDVINSIISCFRRGELTLPSPPKIGARFKDLIDKGAGIQEITELLKQDMSISFKLISISNSSYYRGMSKIETLDKAISRLGIDATGQYVEAICNRALYVPTNKKFADFISALWEHSLSCAYATQVLTDLLKIDLQDDPFTIGLFHDIGKLILLQVFGELEIKGQLGEEVSRVAMFNDLDTHHGKFGAAILNKWQFPAVYAQVAMYHDDLEGVDPLSNSILIVHFANLLVKSMGFDIQENPEFDLEDTESACILQIDKSIIADVKHRVKERMAEMATIIR